MEPDISLVKSKNCFKNSQKRSISFHSFSVKSKLIKSLCKEISEVIIALFARKDSSMEYVLFHLVLTSCINFLYLTCNFSARFDNSCSFFGDLLISIIKARTLSITGLNFLDQHLPQEQLYEHHI